MRALERVSFVRCGAVFLGCGLLFNRFTLRLMFHGMVQVLLAILVKRIAYSLNAIELLLNLERVGFLDVLLKPLLTSKVITKVTRIRFAKDVHHFFVLFVRLEEVGVRCKPIVAQEVGVGSRPRLQRRLAASRINGRLKHVVGATLGVRLVFTRRRLFAAELTVLWRSVHCIARSGNFLWVAERCLCF